MLVEFSVENFLSFKDMVTLSLEASTDKESPQNVIESAQGTDLRLLTGAAIYGPNASGKSNFFKALNFMDTFVRTSAIEKRKDSPIGVRPFKLDEIRQSEPSIFEVVFLADGVRYLYGFSVDSQRVHEEWLYSYPHNRRRLLFERRAGRADSSDPAKAYKFGGHWTGESKRLARMTRPSALFISIAAQFNHPQATIVVDWFSKKLRNVSFSPTGKSEEIFTIKMCQDEADLKQAVLRLLKNADPHIENFDIHSQSLKEVLDLDSEGVPPALRELIKGLEMDPEKPVLQVTTVHHGIDKDGKQVLVPFDLGEESDGTQKYFSLAGPLIHVLSKGCCLLADELDLHLHLILARAIVEMFHDPKINTKGAQLVFATHNTDLLEQKGLLRRDQIWFTEKKESGATDLYSAWDFKARKGENLGKGYLAGRYGAIPYIERLHGPIDHE